MAGEIIKDRLPAVALLFGRVLSFGIEGHTYGYAVFRGTELDHGLAPAECIGNGLMRDDCGVGAVEIEAHATIPCLHP